MEGYNFTRFKRKSFILLGRFVDFELIENIKNTKIFKNTLQANRYKLEHETNSKVGRTIRSAVKLDEDTIAYSGFSDCIYIWSIKKKETIKTLEGSESEFIDCIIKIHTTRIASTNNRNTIAIWDYEKGTCLYTLKSKRKSHFSNVIKLNKTQLITTSATLKLWDLEKRTWTIEIHQLGQVHSLLRINATTIASSSQSNKGVIDIWNMENGKHIQDLRGHKDTICMIKKLDGDMLASVDVEDIVRVWSLAEGDCIFELKYGSSKGWIKNIVNWNKNGMLICNKRGGICVWDFQDGICKANIYDIQNDTANKNIGCAKLNKYQLISWDFFSGSFSIVDVLIN